LHRRHETIMSANKIAPLQTRVDFAYSFSTPHRLTATLPNSRDKTLLDCQPGYLRMSWTYEDLTQMPIFAFLTPTTRWELSLTPTIDGQRFAHSTWTRVDGFLPALDNTYQDGRGSIKLEVVGGAPAAMVRVTLTNTGDKTHQFKLAVEKPGAWAGMNPAWVDSAVTGDLLMAGWLDRADRILVLGCGADTYPVIGATAVCMEWDIPAGETRTAWVVRPYRAYSEDADGLRSRDWAEEYNNAIATWHELVAKATRFHIPDPGVQNAFYACLCDLFVMRESLADGHIVGTPGTEAYRAPNSYEAGIMAVALDQTRLHDESERGFELPLSLQEPNGDWTEPKGWAHLMWGGAGFKSWVALTHYRLTGDRAFLEKLYPRLRASSRWQESMRARMRVSRDDLTYGLMPRGMGDCGLKDGDDLYGVFIPHNIWAVYADKLSMEAAIILGHTEDLTELERIYRTALEDLLRAMDRGAIQEDNYRWIPGVPGKTSGSRWGVLNALFPTEILAADHELINGTLRYIESHLSPGGIPVNTGWMTDGMWVAITLDNIAEAHLARGEGDPAAEYLYAVLNHGTPLYTWCEERGQEPYTAKTSGDRQHLWTPVAVVRTVRDCMIFERNNNLELGLGVPRAWLATGESIGVDNAPTNYGEVSYVLRYDAAKRILKGHVSLPANALPGALIIHVRLPVSMHAKSVNAASNGTLSGDGQTVRWEHPGSQISFELTIA
ncbi:MAG TPA: hypothetical protein VGK81_10235, partial [Anaerolineae bacterium]